MSSEAGRTKRILNTLEKTEEEDGMEEDREDDGVKRIG